jgi:acrylyl-CoA reductase (NADPH)
MKTFKAFRIEEQEGQICSGFQNISVEDLTPGDVLIKAVYSNINYKDALAATGKGSILKRFPLTGGIDVAGVVEHSSDERFKPGDQVVICGSGLSEIRDGGYAEYIRAPADYVIDLPEGITLFQAMAIGSAGFTAALAIQKMQHNGQQPTMGPVAVTGATGGVGSYAVDLLAGLGYQVTAITGKQSQQDYLLSLGAERVLLRQQLDMGSRPLEKGLWGGAVDCVGGKLLAWLTRTVQPLGNIAVIGLTGGIAIETTVMPFILRGINLLGINSVVCPESLKRKIWQRLATDMQPRHIDKIVTAEIEFTQLPEMFDAYIQGNVTGRTVVRIGEP